MAAAQQRPSSRRGPSMQWGRLKPAATDPLDAYGLPSKGETRLNDFRAQESYYNKIVERYMKFCAASGGGETLDKQFAALAREPSGSQSLQPTDPNTTTTANPIPPPRNPTLELSTILLAMRKLREAILSSHRLDRFSQRCYIFIIRASILVKAWESYLPALRYLLHAIHPATALSPPEYNEFAGYHLLDLACRQHDLTAAFHAKSRLCYGYRDPTGRVERVLRALVMDDWVGFWRVGRAVDGYQKRMLEWREEEMRTHALKCLGRSYLSVEKGFVERSAGGRGWAELVREGVGWELVDGERVVIRRPKVK
ncbi:hypothetical protein K490DRAFT_47745 [Saccharata proteae CBS 121410]|uniref:CSN8/PSMD8/EIF3K domain-containing protein n=1 Tax=Saccharata proteae CBS 121410 TaxID=1314787 RepID=A0A9P4HTC9_9PEZI|nr:hypothetical protein K490DRAFT_47745 [Saccharata proteae CBS 121410]